MARFACTFAVVAAALAPCTGAQRSPFFATVVGPDGAPLPAAELCCVFTPDLTVPGATDVVIARTDARGRARCELLVGRVYVAWAIGAADRTGASCVTPVMPLVTAGQVRELHALEHGPPRRIRVRGHDAWRSVGVAALRWSPDAMQDVQRGLPWPVDGIVELPPSPSAVGCLALSDGAGEIVAAVTVQPEDAEAPEFAAPMELRASACGADGRPLVGVTIEHRVLRHVGRRLFEADLNGWQPVCSAGRTGPDGVLRFHVPTPANVPARGRQQVPGAVVVFARKDGFERQAQAVTDAGEVSFRMPVAPATMLRVPGADAAHVRVAAFGSVHVRMPGGGALFSRWPLAVARVRAGEFSVSTDGCTALLPRPALDGEPPTAIATDWIAPVASPAIDIAPLRKIELQVLDAAGGPVACAVGVGIVGDGYPMRWATAVATDAAGRAVLRVPDGGFCAYATNGTAHAVALLDSPALTMTLEPIPVVRVSVRDRDGRPVGGARIVGVRYQLSTGGTSVLDAQRGRVAADFIHQYPHTARSGADGTLVVPLFHHPGLSAEEVHVRAGSRTSASFELKPGAEPEVRLRD